MTQLEAAYNALKTSYETSKGTYDTSYTAYEPYAYGVTAARTNFSNDYNSIKSADNAWNILHLSRDNPAIVGVPSNPSVGQVAFAKNRMETAKRSWWTNQLNYY